MVIFVIILVGKKILVYFHQHFYGNTFTKENQCTCIKRSFFLKAGKSDKVFRYGFSAICSTSSRSENWNFVWMIRAPNAMRRGLATLPVSLGNSLAYFISNSSHGIRSASLIQRLSRFMWSPKGWLKSRKECCSLSIGLYSVLAPICSKSVKNCKKNDFFVKILAIIIPENVEKSVKSSVCNLISRH